MLAFGTLLCAGRSDLAGSSYFYGAGRGDVSGSALQVRPSYCRAPSTLPAASPGAKGKARDRTDEMHAGIQLCQEVLHEDELYEILGVGRKASLDEIRRAFLGRSRVIHPEYVLAPSPPSHCCPNRPSSGRLAPVSAAAADSRVANYHLMRRRRLPSSASRLRTRRCPSRDHAVCTT